MSGRPKGAPAASFALAHEAATLVDQTIDKPRGTSEHYLEAWARVIETKLATTLAVTADTQRAVAAFQRSVDRGVGDLPDELFRARRDQYARFTQRLAEQVPDAKDLLAAGSRQQLDATGRSRGERGGTRGGSRRGATTELRRLWTDTLRPAWKKAVLAESVPGLRGPALQLEKHLLEIEDRGTRDFLLPRGGSALNNEVYWQSGHGESATPDPQKAAAMARWAAERRTKIVAWAQTTGNPAVREAAEKIGPGPVFVPEPPRPMSRKIAAERVLLYRRVLAAWEFLIAMKAEPELRELRTLIELENTPVRPRPAQ
jgi:hypothetical protein